MFLDATLGIEWKQKSAYAEFFTEWVNRILFLRLLDFSNFKFLKCWTVLSIDLVQLHK